jgi:hypothetical protein
LPDERRSSVSVHSGRLLRSGPLAKGFGLKRQEVSMRGVHGLAGIAALLLVPGGIVAQDLGGWLAPEGGWDYVYQANDGEDIDGEFDASLGGSLDGTWTHNNGSDVWDGSGPGDELRPDGVTRAAPGGAGIVIIPDAAEGGGDAEVLSIVDTGDPGSRGFPDPNNRKMWFCHDVSQDGIDGGMSLRNGMTFIVRSRNHPDVNPAAPGWQLPDGGVDNDAGQGAAPGYTLRDGGKGGHGFYDTALDRNFSFTPFGVKGYQFPPQVGEGLPPANFLDVGDNAVFHSFWITVEDPESDDRYTVSVYVDGDSSPARVFENIALGDDTDCDGISHLHMGFHSTPQVGGFQIDYFGYKLGLHEPEAVCPGGFKASFDPESGQVALDWSRGQVTSYTLRENGADLQTSIPASTTTFVVASPARPSATYELVSVGRDCPTVTVTATTVVCPELSCSADSARGEVTLTWTDPRHFAVAGFAVVRNGVEVGQAASAARSFTDKPPPGNHTYELKVQSGVAGACAVSPFCEVALYAPGAINIAGNGWDQVVFNGQAQKVITTDGAKSLYFPAAPKTAGDVAVFAVEVADLGQGEIDGERYRVEVRARYDNDVRITNRSLEPPSLVHLALSRTGQSIAGDDAGVQEVVEQVPAPPGAPTVDSASSTIVNTETVGILLADGLNIIEVSGVDPGGNPHADQVQLFELRIGFFAAGLQSSIVPFPCPSGLTCTRRTDGKIDLAWSSPDPHAYELFRDSESIAVIPKGDTKSFTDDPGEGFFSYTLRITDSAFCPELSCAAGGGIPDDEGYIREWLILGPLDYGCITQGLRRCDQPGIVTIQKDYLAGTVDGQAVTELDIEPEAGMDVVLGAQVRVKPAARPDINPGAPGTARWFAYQSGYSAVDHNAAFGADPGNDYMVYNAVYIENTDNAPLTATLQVASDDSVQVIQNGASIHTNNIARGVNIGAPDQVAGVTLEPGLNLFLVKIYEGAGGTGLAMRFVDDIGLPLTADAGLRVRLGDTGPPPRPRFRRADANADGGVNIADASFTLNYLFLGGPDPACIEAADANGDGSVNIADASFALNFLFLGGPNPPAPGSDDCGEDPDPPGSPKDLGCNAYERCP